jgi:8-oxo-dGTP pyrophosphatase MutT (NUDIX family)
MSVSPFRLDAALRWFAADFPAQSATVEQFLQLRMRGEAAFHRDCWPGHFTGSAWLVSADGRRALLTHHRKLDRWLQLGGHADGDIDLRAVALREATEESGLGGLQVDAGIFDIDCHAIPARGGEPEHWHHDVRFVVRAGGDERFSVSVESKALAWVDIEELARRDDIDASLRRMATRWLQQAA